MKASMLACKMIHSNQSTEAVVLENDAHQHKGLWQGWASEAGFGLSEV